MLSGYSSSSGSFDLGYTPSPKILDSIERLNANEEDDAAIAAILAADNDLCDRPDCPQNIRMGYADLDVTIEEKVTTPARRGFMSDFFSMFTLPVVYEHEFDDCRGTSSSLFDLKEEREARREEKTLNERLHAFGLTRYCVAGDGNCQFRALSDQIYRAKNMHRIVRGLVVKELTEHPER